MMNIRLVNRDDFSEWLRLRQALWPDCPPTKHQQEMQDILQNPDQMIALVAECPEGGLCGFLEASLRAYAEDCETSPIGYIEGWYVEPNQQRRGVGRALVQAAESWAIHKGCREMASDCQIDNQTSLLAHLSLGYQETERLIHFRKPLF